MVGNSYRVIGLLAGLLLASPLLAAPSVKILGVSTSGDAVGNCGLLAASPYEAARPGAGVEDDEIFLNGAIAACEAAVTEIPDSDLAHAWLGRVYLLAGRLNEATALLSRAGEAGNPFADYLLSRALELGAAEFSSEAGANDAFDLLVRAADGGFPPAASDLGRRHETGNGFEIDYVEAARFYQIASDGGVGFATYKLGSFYQGGFDVDVDYGRAARLFELAAEQGEPLGYYGLGQLQEFGQGVPLDSAKAAEFYQLGADGGEKMSQTALAYFYEQGIGVPQDYGKSFELLKSASAQDWGFAHAALSIHYLFGQGTEVDEVKAYELAWAAQFKGIVYADGVLGYLFENGLGTVRDLASALQHFQDGANGGDQYSADQIAGVETEMACLDAAGSTYEPGSSGHGVAFDAIDAPSAIDACDAAISINPQPVGNKVWLARAYVKAGRYEDAVPLLEQGIAAGNVLAHGVYGDMLFRGDGVATDPQRAVALYEAVSASFAPAQFALGVAYAEGVGVEADRGKALEFLRLAEGAGVPGAAEQIAALEPGTEMREVDLSGFGREGPGY